MTGTLRAWAGPVKRDGVTLWFALRHPATPWSMKAIAAVVVAYALRPADLIPDFVPVLGYIDDFTKPASGADAMPLAGFPLFGGGFACGAGATTRRGDAVRTAVHRRFVYDSAIADAGGPMQAT